MVGVRCAVCKEGFSVMDAEQYFDKKTKITTYLCKEHLTHCPSHFIHLPWELNGATDVCVICEKTGGKCARNNSIKPMEKTEISQNLV